MESTPSCNCIASPFTRLGRLVEGLVLVLAAGFVVLGTQVAQPKSDRTDPLQRLKSVVGSLGDTANSRLATVYSLAHQGTWRIDTPEGQPPNWFERGSVDKVEIEGRLLSSKPPVLPLLMTGEYLALRALTGWSLEGAAGLRRVVYWMTLSLIGLPYLITLLFFARTVRFFCDCPWMRAFVTAVLAFASQLPGLATDLNNHVPAACALMIMLYFTLGLCADKLPPRPWRFFCFGLCGGLVFTLDMPLTIFFALAGLYLLRRFPVQTVVWGGLGLALPLLVHFAVMIAVTGSPKPVQTRPELYLYESSSWRTPGGVDALHEPKGTYLFHMTFGRNGLFLMFPILLAAILESLIALVRPSPWRGWLLAGLAGFVILSAYYLLKTNNYGGASYGFRWYVASMPVLILMATPLLMRLKRPGAWAVVVLLLGVSMFSAWESYRMPWGSDHEWTCRWIFGPVYGTPEQTGTKS